MAQIETSHEINFQLGVGEHKLRFSPKEQYKDELSLRSLTLPVVNLKGAVKRRERTKVPQVSIEVGVKTINIDLTTDVLNQLLILQNTFIKVCFVYLPSLSPSLLALWNTFVELKEQCTD